MLSPWGGEVIAGGTGEDYGSPGDVVAVHLEEDDLVIVDEDAVTLIKHFGPGGDYWQAFFSHRLADYHGDANFTTSLKAELLKAQRKAGHQKGSWDPSGTISGNCGRLFTTSMGATILSEIENGIRLQP